MQPGHTEPHKPTRSQSVWVEDSRRKVRESSENQACEREGRSVVSGLFMLQCYCSSVTACSTQRCSCVSKGIKCGPGCRCKNCSNAVNTAASSAPIPLQCTDDILEIEQEELLCNDSLRRECGEESVGEEDKDVFSSSDDEEDEVGIYA